MEERLLRVEGLFKSYRHPTHVVEVLKGLDFELLGGEVVAVVGASGVGKSTFLHIVGTLDQPDRGCVIIEGMDVFRMSGRELAEFRNKTIGFVFQMHNLLPEFSALENVMLPALIGREAFASARARALELLREVGLEDRSEHKPGELSGGEQQRVTLARALVNRPRLVLADEPAGNLDRTSGDELFRLLIDLSEKSGESFIVATHNERQAAMASRVLTLEDGVLRG